MGYADKQFRETQRVELSEDYYARIRRLNREQLRRAEDALSDGDQRVTAGAEETRMRLDTAAYRDAMVRQSIIEWNLDDDEGQVWPIDTAHVNQLASADFETIWQAVNELNRGRSKDERQRFRAGGDRLGRHGDALAGSDDRPVRGGEHVLARAGADEE